MKLGHICLYHNAFFKFDNGPYRIRLSVVMALCWWKFTVLNDVGSLTRTFFSEFYETGSHCLIPWCLLQVWYWSISHHAFSSYGPLFMKIHCFKWCPLSNSNTFYQNFMKLGHIVKNIDVFSKFDNEFVEFDPGPVPYFRGDWSWNNFYGHSPPFRWFIQEGLLSVTSESMCTNYW